MTKEIVGILGGTFNPIHAGHLRAAEETLRHLNLSKILLVPSSVPVLKTKGIGKDFIAPAKDRAHWVELATRNNPKFQLCRIELQREGPSYTVDTLRTLSLQLKPSKLMFIIGSDAFRNFDSWYQPDEILSMANFAVLARPPEILKSLRNILPAKFHSVCKFSKSESSARHQSGNVINLIEISGLEISSTDIRRRLSQGYSVRGLLPDLIREAIESSGYFSEAAL